MKRIFLLIAVALGFLATKVNAQQRPGYGSQSSYYKAESPVRFGIRAGASLADWNGETMQSVQDLVELTDGSVTQKMREGFHVGGYVSIPVAPGFEIEPGLQYSQKGMVLQGKIPVEQVDFLNTTATITNKAEYLDLPVLAKVYVGEGFHIFAGPQVSYLLSNKVQAEAGALGFKALNQEWDMKSGFREVDFAVTGGLGYRFQNGFNLSAGYDYGLNSIDDNGSFDTYNHVVKASIGYTF
ncbi:outer membrane protein with beta-barrel domain [Pontibacter ummariensis]|uniref:Outer membrane protein beta-barrel domain-containing protein n=1 Tax=Pontibacter ummariensis TaxID=1610492 RepID=A0A239JPU5_9BACT|nr:porin family protein [Pontibacter ummariensis]PRY07352.1 outer membrane protein with beta-barrel domain [Pontibacter ummariensis]SNT07373.1 Outer membrane protein beta-barrel domain-containing protein [Pontibacter ummariensis]